MARDPVCSMHIEESTPFIAENDGTRYYFCSEGCKKSFDREPKKYSDNHKRLVERFKEHSNKW